MELILNLNQSQVKMLTSALSEIDGLYNEDNSGFSLFDDHITNEDWVDLLTKVQQQEDKLFNQ